MADSENNDQVALFNEVGAALHDVVYQHGFIDHVLNEQNFETTLKSLMFFTIRMVYDQQIPEATMVAYVRGVYNDLRRMDEGRDERAETIATLTEQ